MKISIVGTGYVGIVTALCLCHKGHNVICIDKQKSIVDKINNGISPIYEPGLDSLLTEELKNNKISASTNIDYAVKNTDVTIISVGTPYKNNKIDLSYIEQASYEIGEAIKTKAQYHVVCVKSTVVPGTTDMLVKDIIEKASLKKVGDFGLAMNPEFLREGSAVDDFMYPDRIVIGAYDDKSFEVMSDIYKCFTDVPIIKVNPRTAEMIKYTSNSLLASLISFSNEIAAISEETGGIDTKEVLAAVSLDKRLNPLVNGNRVNPPILDYLKAGCGFGGSCFPKDVAALIAFAEEKGYNAGLLQTVMDINKNQADRMLQKLKNELGDLKDKKIIVLGLAFKPDTDDVRESPALTIIQKLIAEDVIVYAVDPLAVENAIKILGHHTNLIYSQDIEHTSKSVDAVILVTPWKCFTEIKPDQFKAIMPKPVLLDGRRVFDKEAIAQAGIKYLGTGLT